MYEVGLGAPRYSAYPSVGIAGFGLGGDPAYSTPAGWARTSTNAFDLWWQRQKRLPTQKERTDLLEQVKQIRGGAARLENLTFEHHHEVLSFLTKHGRMPTGYPANDKGENAVLVQKAIATVSAQEAAYAAAHPSFGQSLLNIAGGGIRAAIKAETGQDVTITSVSIPAEELLTAAQFVISFVPGIGAGINAAIAAGAALARGENITDALVAGVKNSLPGGPVAAAGFDAAYAAGKAIINGENIGDAALAATRAALPTEEARRAFDVGLAVVQGQNVQQALIRATASLAPSAAKTAAEIFKQPELLKLPVAEVAKLLNTDPSSVTAATTALRSDPVLTTPPVKKPPVLKSPPSLTPSPRLIANLAAVARKNPKATDAEVLYVAVLNDKVLAVHANRISPQLISNMILVARKFPNAKDAEILYVASIPVPPKKPPVLRAPSGPTSAIARGAYAPYPKNMSAA